VFNPSESGTSLGERGGKKVKGGCDGELDVAETFLSK